MHFNKFVPQTNWTIHLTYRVTWWLANWQLWHIITVAGISFFCDVHTTHTHTHTVSYRHQSVVFVITVKQEGLWRRWTLWCNTWNAKRYIIYGFSTLCLPGTSLLWQSTVAFTWLIVKSTRAFVYFRLSWTLSCKLGRVPMLSAFGKRCKRTKQRFVRWVEHKKWYWIESAYAKHMCLLYFFAYQFTVTWNQAMWLLSE